MTICEVELQSFSSSHPWCDNECGCKKKRVKLQGQMKAGAYREGLLMTSKPLCTMFKMML